MLYDYQCEKCDDVEEQDHRMGQAPRSVKCRCGATAKRVYNGFAVSIDGNVDRKSGFGEEMKKRNEKAAYRMQGQKPNVTTVAHDYGGGDVREVKK